MQININKSSMNILILSVGTRNKIVQYLKKELNHLGKVVAADMSRNAPALYDADKYYIVPPVKSSNYINEIIKICKKEKISAIFSLIDTELSLLAQHEEKFGLMGIKIIVSKKKTCDISFDKWKMYQLLKIHNFLTAKTYIELDKFKDDLLLKNIHFPVIVKPRDGSASLMVQKVDDLDLLNYLFKKYDNLLIQEFIDGQEIGIDCYIDMISKQLVSLFAKKKLIMRAGETDKSISYKDYKLFELIREFITKLEFFGPIDIDVFLKDGEYYISEVNPRFGGGYPHAYSCGVNFMSLLLNNLQGNENPASIGDYKENIYCMKYSEISIIGGE